MTSICQLSSVSTYTDTAVMSGLRIQDGALIADPKKFTCCGGSGALDKKAESIVHRCNMRERLAATYNLLQRHATLYSSIPDLAQWQVPAELLESLQNKMTKKQRPGSVAKLSTYNLQDWWALAMIATWRFGHNVLVVDFTKTQEIDSDIQKFIARARQPLLIMALGIRKLWDTHPANQLDMLVSCAYQTNALAWFVFDSDSTEGEAPAAPGAKKGIMSRRVEVLKAKSPLQFIEAACYSRLTEMCDVVSLKG